MRISQFIKTIEKNKLIKFNQPDIVLDPILSNHDMICQDLCLLLDRVSNPEKVQAIVLVVGWLCLGDKTLLLKLTKFKNISTLFLKGKPDPSVLYGFSNSSLKLMAKSFGNLTKLFLDGYGGNNFTWLALVRLLKNNPKLECLSLNRVRNGINLTELMEICLNLKSLTIQFSIHIPINNNARFMEGDDMALLFHGLTNASHQLIPELKGDLKSCHLKEISFHNHMNSDRQSSEVIYRVLSSIPTTKMPFDPAFYEVGTVLSLKD
ncbi:hypothetical protein BC833DRAFT_575308 [Globomyces pollinis-pini]|nr:hypothetical protein BC833DRAFT_575308 [Globomyces pollinis-pini]